MYKNFCYKKNILLLYWVGVGLLHSKSTCNTDASYNNEFCGNSEAENTHLGRKASVTVENLKYSFRNGLKAQ